MSGTQSITGGSDPNGALLCSGSTVPIGQVSSTASAQSSAAVSVSVGRTRSNMESEQKQFHDDNRSKSTTGGSLSLGANGGNNGNRSRPRPRVEPLLMNHQPIGNWPPYGMPLNYTPATVPLNQRGPVPNSVQFGYVPNNQGIFYANWNLASTSSSSTLSTAMVRHLIIESHLDLVNLLTSHLKTMLDPIVAYTNAKYEQLAKQFDTALGSSEDVANAAYILHGMAMEETCELGDNSEHDEIPIPERIRLIRRDENAENVLHNVVGNGRLA
ncbi:hypothetical protein PIB30_093022 [Stylosanthes scabra]|uniref:Uncharacterized protein n=1 Tax=Stylosanthes scabra TaxID=79078 RepID=A0ABU6UTS7_9FABA|nr:hypothetical protein [Stylosanthes scabra]